MNGVNPRQVLQLYRNLLRYGQRLKFTDQKYFRQRVQEEFRSNKTQESKEQVEFLYKKGQSLLENKRVI